MSSNRKNNKSLVEQRDQVGAIIILVKRIVICRILRRHKYFIIKEYSKTVRKVGCRYCGKVWGMNDRVKAFVEWDGELEEISENLIKRNKSINTPSYVSIEELRKAAKCVFLATDAPVAQDLANKLNGAANKIEALQDFVKWMASCEYDFYQHYHYRKMRNELLGDIIC